MPYTDDPYDPDEEQRRRQAALAPSEDYLDPEEDELESPGAGPVKPTNAQTVATEPVAALSTPSLSPAEQRYKDVLSTAPRAADYRPSRLRRIGAAIAGGLTGARDPRTGVEVAQQITGAPYAAAQRAWEQQVGVAAKQAGVDEEAAKLAVSRQRATSYAQSSAARAEQERATADLRRRQMENVLTPEQRTELARIQHPGIQPTGTAAEIEFYKKDPQGYEHWKTLEEKAKRGQVMTLQEKEDFEKYKSNLRAGEIRLRAGLRTTGKPAKPPSPKDISAAEQLAIAQAIREDPSYANFIEGGQDILAGVAGRPTGKKMPYTVKSIDKIVAPDISWFDSSGAEQTKNAMARDKYKQFLQRKQAIQQGILSGGSGGAWTIQQSPEESQEDTSDEEEEEQ